MVRNEVFACVSSIVADLANGYGSLGYTERQTMRDRPAEGALSLMEEAAELSYSVEDHEEALRGEGWKLEPVDSDDLPAFVKIRLSAERNPGEFVVLGVRRMGERRRSRRLHGDRIHSRRGRAMPANTSKSNPTSGKFSSIGSFPAGSATNSRSAASASDPSEISRSGDGRRPGRVSRKTPSFGRLRPIASRTSEGRRAGETRLCQ